MLPDLQLIVQTGSTLCVRFPSCPGVHVCARVGGGGFELCKRNANKTQTIFDY